MGSNISHQAKLDNLYNHAALCNKAFLHDLDSHNNNKYFIHCCYRARHLHNSAQCSKAINTSGSVYCDEYDLSAKKDTQAYLENIRQMTLGGWMSKELRCSYVKMIKANIQYNAYKQQLDKEYLKAIGIADRQQFMSVQLVEVCSGASGGAMIKVLANIICDYLDFTPELMAIRGPVALSLYNATDVHILDVAYRAFVYNHEWQRFVGIDTANLYYTGMIHKINPQFSILFNHINYSLNALNYCTLATTAGYEIVDLS